MIDVSGLLVISSEQAKMLKLTCHRIWCW